MKISKLLNKNYFSIIFILLLVTNSFAEEQPVDIWNIENNFDSFNFHQARSSFTFNIFHAINSIFLQSLLLLK